MQRERGPGEVVQAGLHQQQARRGRPQHLGDTVGRVARGQADVDQPGPGTGQGRHRLLQPVAGQHRHPVPRPDPGEQPRGRLLDRHEQVRVAHLDVEHGVDDRDPVAVPGGTVGEQARERAERGPAHAPDPGRGATSGGPATRTARRRRNG